VSATLLRRSKLVMLAAVATLTALGGAAAPAPAAAVTPHASLPQIERQVMCVTCKIPLMVAESSQADRERAYIQSLIDKGENEAQIKRSLVGQYGSSVLGLPGDRGFDVTAYLVPLIAVIGLAAMLVVLLPRWRRRTREREANAPPGTATLSGEDAARLEADLARFD
jgi:cytochrome c-type biogenesis protein CcmH/NrfF